MDCRRFVTLLLGLFTLAMVRAQQSFSLQEAITYAQEHNADVRIEQLNVQDADGQLLEYKSIGIPKINADVDYAYFIDIPTQILPDFLSPAVYGVLFEEGVIDPKPIPTGGSAPVRFGKDHNLDASLSLETMIFDFAWIQGLKAQALFRDLVQKNVTAKAFEIRSKVTRAYLAVLINKRSLALLDDNIRNLETLYNETRAIYENGFAEQLDVDRLALSLDNLRTDRQNVERLADVTRNLLKFQMGYPITEPIELTDDFDVLAGQVSVASVSLTDPVDYNERPEYVTFELREQLNEINMKVIKSGYLPTLRGRASWSRTLQRDKLFDSNDSPWFPSSMLGVTLNVPIFDGLEKKARLERARISRDKVSIARSEFERAVDLEVRNARIQFHNASETVQARRNSMDLAQRIYDTTQIKYREGVGSSIELTQAEAELYRTQSNYINALYDLIVAKTELDIALGKI
ncbi:MAG: TolC family protein [Saprospiraceae bacterium]|nr:TolC family protein [Saprospiraceae bacterium]